MELKSLTKKEKRLIAEFRLCKKADKDSIVQKITDLSKRDNTDDERSEFQSVKRSES